MSGKLKIVYEENQSWHTEIGKTEVSVVVLEQQPQRRCLKIGRQVFYLALPYSQFAWINRRRVGELNGSVSALVPAWSQERWGKEIKTYLPCLPNLLDLGDVCFGDVCFPDNYFEAVDLFWTTGFTVVNDVTRGVWKGISTANKAFSTERSRGCNSRWAKAFSQSGDPADQSVLNGYREWDRRTRVNTEGDWILRDQVFWNNLLDWNLSRRVRLISAGHLMREFG